MQYIIVTGVFRKEGRRWLAECPELGTATFGRSLSEADARLKEAITLHLNTLEDVGETERFFAENGITVYPEISKATTVPIDAPIEPDTFVRALQTPLPQREPSLIA
jgi:predicted RNase H-like HicB family nuclease